MGSGNPRKVVFIDKRFQTDFILKFAMLLLVGTAIFGVSAYLILDRRLDQSYYSAHLTIKSVGEILKPTLIWLSLVFITVLSLAAVVIILYVSHHVAGPLFAIRRYLENVARGELDFEPRLRDKDQTTPLAQSLAAAVGTLNTKLVGIRSAADAVRSASQNFSVYVERHDNAADQCRKDLSVLLDQTEKLTREIEFFHLRKPPEKA